MVTRIKIKFRALTIYNFLLPYSAGECLELGRHSYLIGEDDYALAWLTQSMSKYEVEKEKTAAIEDILQYSAFSSYKKGRLMKCYYY